VSGGVVFGLFKGLCRFGFPFYGRREKPPAPPPPNDECRDFDAVINTLYKNTSIKKTCFKPSTFIIYTGQGQHYGLLVKQRCVVKAGEVCAILCSNEIQIPEEPPDRQSDFIQARGKKKEYYLDFIFNIRRHIIGAAANGHFYHNDPPSNANFHASSSVFS